MKNVIIIMIIAIIGGVSCIGINKSKIDSAIDNGELKILLEKNINYTGMPGPNDECYWGRSLLICNDGSVYMFEYDEYNGKGYPYKDHLDELTKQLITNSKKQEKSLSQSEIEKLQTNIDNIVNKNEKMVLNEIDNDMEIIQPEDATSREYLNIFCYEKNEKMNIEGYTSPSIEEIVQITEKYF